MTKPRAIGKSAKPIEITFTPCDLVSKPGDVPIIETLGFHEVTRLQTEENDRVGAEINERLETRFQHFGVARTGDDLCDYQNLALAVAIERLPESRIKDDPDLLELLFPLFGVILGKGGPNAFAYKLLILQLMKNQELFRIEKRPYKHKPSNPLALLRLLADAEVVRSKWSRRRHSDREIAKHLIEKEARWAGMDWKTLRNWFAAAHKLFKRDERRSDCPENQ
jgi:hypothetical protein